MVQQESPTVKAASGSSRCHQPGTSLSRELSAEQVLSDISDMMKINPSDVAHDFTASYVGPPHPMSQRIPEVAAGTYFVEWAREIQPAAFQMEKEATRMMASLLGRPEAVGFITSGGTESNMSALRLARNLAGVSQPEVVMPESGHYSFRIAADVLGIKLNEARLRDDFSPDMDHVERLITDNTVALVCSIPEGLFGQLDPVVEFSNLAQEKSVYLHVDGAFGGFILPFMRELGHEVAPFDFRSGRCEFDDDRRPQAGDAAGSDRLLPGAGRGACSRRSPPRALLSTT